MKKSLLKSFTGHYTTQFDRDYFRSHKIRIPSFSPIRMNDEMSAKGFVAIIAFLECVSTVPGFIQESTLFMVNSHGFIPEILQKMEESIRNYGRPIHPNHT